MSCWYLTEHAISIALINRFKAGVQVRLIGDRGSIFEIDPITKSEFYWLANQGLPIRLRFNPTWFPEIDHMKMTLFVGQNLVTFGSANYTPFELAPTSATNYKDEIRSLQRRLGARRRVQNAVRSAVERHERRSRTASFRSLHTSRTSTMPASPSQPATARTSPRGTRIRRR